MMSTASSERSVRLNPDMSYCVTRSTLTLVHQNSEPWPGSGPTNPLLPEHATSASVARAAGTPNLYLTLKCPNVTDMAR